MHSTHVSHITITISHVTITIYSINLCKPSYAALKVAC